MTTAASPTPAPRGAAATAPHRRLLGAVTAVCAVAALAACNSSTTAGLSTAPGTSAAASTVPVTTLINGYRVLVLLHGALRLRLDQVRLGRFCSLCLLHRQRSRFK